MLNFIGHKYKNLLSDKKFSEILTGSAWALAARVLSAGLVLVTSIVVARFYGAEMVGIVAVIQSFLMLATTFTTFGTQTSLLRLIPEHLVRYSPTSAFNIYRKTQIMVIVVSVVAGSVLFVCSDLIATRVFSKPHLSFYFSLASIFVVFQSLTLLNTQAARGLRLIRVFALMQVLPYGFNLLLLLVFGLIWSAREVPVFALLGGFALAAMLGWSIVVYAFRQKMRSEDPVHPMPAFEIFSISFPMLMTQTMTFVIGQTGVIVLGMYSSDSEVGYYAIAVKLATLTAFILNAVNAMAGPKFSEFFHSGKMDELFHVAKKSAKLIFWTTVPILLGLTFLGKPVLSIFFGREFVAAYPPLVLLIVGQFVHSVSGSSGLFMDMTGNQKVLRNIMFLAAFLNIILSLSLIPGFGTQGAAIAAMVSLGAWNIATLIFMKIKYGHTTGYLPLLPWRHRPRSKHHE